jgi:hypothetical protein
LIVALYFVAERLCNTGKHGKKIVQHSSVRAEGNTYRDIQSYLQFSKQIETGCLQKAFEGIVCNLMECFMFKAFPRVCDGVWGERTAKYA